MNEEQFKMLYDALTGIATLRAKEVLNMGDVCTLTGLSKSHIYKLVYAKRIPYYKGEGGRLTYFKKSEIEDWLLAHRVPTNAELQQQAIKYCNTKRS